MRTTIAGAVAALVVLLGAGTLGRVASAHDAEVTIADFAFNPAEVRTGDHGTVTWTNTDPVVHTVTSVDGLFDGGRLGTGETFVLDVTTLAPGEYRYMCQIHQDMRGVIVVTEAEEE